MDKNKSGKEENGMAGIKDIAKACGVSISTVSNILNSKPGASEATVQLVQETAKRLNYRPNYIAKNLAQRNKKTVGVITEDLTVFTSPEIVDGVNQFCEENQYQIVLGNLRLYKKYKYEYYFNDKYAGQVQNEFEEMLAKQVAGIIYIGGHERKITAVPKHFAVPVVTAYGFTDCNSIPAVVVGDEKAGYDAANYLLEHGHKRIGVIAGPETSFHMQTRLKGFQKALYEHQIFYNPEDVIHGDWEREFGYHAAKDLIDRGITAIFSMNDMMAGGLYQYVSENGLSVGRDISVMGFDNREFCTWFKPGLTTMCLPLHDIGYKSAEVLLNMINGEETNPLYQIECKLIERGSVLQNTIR
jgi:LacI family transcriptional regulator